MQATIGSSYTDDISTLVAFQGALIRSAEGNSYARIRLDSINYPDNVATTPDSWVFNFDIQPAY